MSARSVASTTSARPSSTSKERGRALATKVRTTIEPGKVLEVDDAELVDLHRLGLLYSFDKNDSTDRIVGAKSPNRWRDGKVEDVESGVVHEGETPEEGGH